MNKKPKLDARPPIAGLTGLADDLGDLAILMRDMAARMEYFGGLDGELQLHARELAGAAILARGWAKAIRSRGAGK